MALAIFVTSVEIPSHRARGPNSGCRTVAGLYTESRCLRETRIAVGWVRDGENMSALRAKAEAEWVLAHQRFSRDFCFSDTSKDGAPDRIRTCDLRLRRPTLYPTELRAQWEHASASRQDRSGVGLGARIGILGFPSTIPYYRGYYHRGLCRQWQFVTIAH